MGQSDSATLIVRISTFSNHVSNVSLRVAIVKHFFLNRKHTIYYRAKVTPRTSIVKLFSNANVFLALTLRISYVHVTLLLPVRVINRDDCRYGKNQYGQWGLLVIVCVYLTVLVIFLGTSDWRPFTFIDNRIGDDFFKWGLFLRALP